jgi:hypothetical protein
MTQNDGVPDHYIPDAALGVVMEVRSTNTNASDTHLNLTGTRRGYLGLDLAKFVRGRQFTNAHYFLNRLSKAARASDGVRTSDGATAGAVLVPLPEAASRMTVTFGLNNSQSLALSL